MGAPTDPGPCPSFQMERGGTQVPAPTAPIQWRTGNSWGPQEIGDHGAPVSLPTLKGHPKKAYKRYQGHFMGPPTDPGPSGSA
ncbi:unnamed protein product [Staurois parvus]|uniref:Uncharacterized protein n=1 Tax=Staurois parvus TaxID=386267 RepID=A0ABN9GNS0_9NEOB|nr:unnamed protein product [Staurois parvus]